MTDTKRTNQDEPGAEAHPANVIEFSEALRAHEEEERRQAIKRILSMKEEINDP